jgi:hypothetical protein
MDAVNKVSKIMTAFTENTGLSTEKKSPRRYLWTDAFAVCNFLAIYRHTRDDTWLTSAQDLVDQVHFVLGRHRDDDTRSGWISGLDDEKGKQHPTFGGLRIGKPLNERKPDEPFDQTLEWDRDGQYYHYLTKWMHALNQVARVTKNCVYNQWAVELAKSAHAGFVQTSASGSVRMYWKMSIDLSCPLVPSMGQHDPLDGLVTYSRLQATAAELFSVSDTQLDCEIAQMASLCEKMQWETSDPLGIGGLLSDAFFIAQLHLRTVPDPLPSLHMLLKDGLSGMEDCTKSPSFRSPPEYRLAFRELGMTIGLHAVQKLVALVTDHPEAFKEAIGKMHVFEEYYKWCDIIESFWLAPENQQVRTWIDHQDINEVMLATSLIPDGYLNL